MALTPSTMAELGTKAPAFELPDTDGKMVSLASLSNGNPVLVMFICNHCPYVKHVRNGLTSLTSEYLKKGVAIVAINSNDADKYPEDSPAMMVKEKTSAGYQFPYLFDATQRVARAYNAACTPDFFLYDKELHLVYRGQMDDSRPGSNTPVTGEDLRAAMDALLNGRAISATQRPSVGCNIKWK